MLVIAIVFPLLLLLAAVLTELAARGRLKRNALAGIRTRSTMRSDNAWVAAHRAASRTIWIGFVLSAVAGIIALVTTDAAAIIAAVVVVIVLAATITISLIQATRAASRVGAP